MKILVYPILAIGIKKSRRNIPLCYLRQKEQTLGINLGGGGGEKE